MGKPGAVASIVNRMLARAGLPELNPDPKQRWYNRKRIVIPGIAVVFVAALAASPDVPDAAQASATATPTPTVTQAAPLVPQRVLPPSPAFNYTPPPTQAPYANCAEAIASGRAPIVLNEPGFSPALDVEGGNPEDGVACEGEPIKGMNLYDPVRYENCSQVRDAGAAPIRVGDPGYSLDLDRDGDGIACEWS